MITLKQLTASYFSISEDELEKRTKECNSIMVEDWKNKKDILSFYKNNKEYIFDLVLFNNETRINNLLHPILYVKNTKILDYGAGIGILDIILGEDNIVYYYDICEENVKFAKFLSNAIGNKPVFLETEEDVMSKTYDGIILTDVLEHLENPMEVVKRLSGQLRIGGWLLTTGLDFSTGEHIPMHLVENKQYRDELQEFFYQEFRIIFYHATANETIYVYIKK